MIESIFSNIKFSFDKSTLTILYTHHKAYIIPVGIVLVCVFTFFFLVSRQIQDVSLTKSEVEEAQKRITVLKENLDTLSKIDELAQNLQLELVSKTLPIEKDFTGILNAISQASSSTGISVADYSFQVGDVSRLPTVSASGPLILTLSLSLQTDAAGAARFLGELSKTVPLSSVGSVQMSGSLSTVNIGFYYRPLSFTKVGFHTPIRNQSSSDSTLLETLSSWQTTGSP